VIKDRDDFIMELLVEIDSKDDSDSDSGPDYDVDNVGGGASDFEEDPVEVPEGDASQEQAPQPKPELEEVPHQVVEP
jgi:hypothetical protein